jgi:hypothetical protein
MIAKAVCVSGWRQYVTIDLSTPVIVTVGSRPVEFEVVTPGFRFLDGNVSWHLAGHRGRRL